MNEAPWSNGTLTTAASFYNRAADVIKYFTLIYDNKESYEVSKI